MDCGLDDIVPGTPTSLDHPNIGVLRAAVAVLTAGYGPGGAREAVAVANEYLRDETASDPQLLLYAVVQLSARLLDHHHRNDDPHGALQHLGGQIAGISSPLSRAED